MYAHQVNRLLRVSRRAGDEWMAHCPFHTDSRASLSVNVRTGLWLCHGCGEKGNIEHLGGERGEPYLDVAAELSDRPLKYPSWSAMLADQRASGHDRWAERGISRETVDEFGLQADDEALIVPTVDGTIRRNFDPSADKHNRKYVYPTGFRKASILYAHELIDGPVVVVCEGPIDALRLWDAGIPAVALLGAVLSDAQEQLLRDVPSAILVIMTDNDDAGRRAGKRIAERVEDRFLVAWPTWQLGVDPGGLDTATLRQLVDDAVESVL